MAWQPSDTLVATEWILPKPGSSDPFAIIRWLEVRLGDEMVWRFRVVTYDEPRSLIGYFESIEAAASAAYTSAMRAMQPETDFGMYNNDEKPR